MVKLEQDSRIYCHDLQSSRERLNKHKEKLCKPSLTFEEHVQYMEVHHHEEIVVFLNNDVNVIYDLLELEDNWESNMQEESCDQLGNAQITSIIDEFLSMVEGPQTPPTDLPNFESSEEGELCD
ncbi:hypothetical protein TorRG33x02_261680 [Trema orientale]|uniref:Uncharacterized protein n=1 Tax=Trema orientale TaxID=63057 RepID=A0A2P5D5K3_TREOI|nr:hypothetical protein TorRG33x02_261680 [Trema orientale]